MKSTLLLFFILLGYATIARGQGDPATNLKGQAASGLGNSASTIVVPNNQSTKLNAYQAILETGNKNLLANPGFEHSVVSTEWINTPTGTATAAMSEDTATPIFGKKSGFLECIGGASGGTCTYYQDVLTSYPLDGMVSIYLQSSSQSGVKLIKRVNAANSLTLDPNDSSTYQDIVSNPALLKIPGAMGTTHTGIAIEITVAASQTITVSIDEAFVGVQDVKQDMPVIEEQGEWLLFSSNLTTSSNINSLTSSKDTAFKGIYTKSTSGLTFNKDATVNVSMFYSLSGTSAIDLRINHQSSLCGLANRASSANPSEQVDCNMKVKAGEVINFETTGTGTVSGRIVIVATSIDETTTVATKADFFSTDTNTLSHKTTAIVAADPVGTFNTYSYAISSNTKTICGTAPTQTVASMKTNGFLIYTRAYNAASTCANPARVEIKIAPAGTSLPTLSKELYKGTGKINSGELDYFIAGASGTSARGLYFKDYNTTTGILVLDSGYNETTVTAHSFIYPDGTGQTSGYLVINAQKAKTTAVADFKEFDYVYVEAAGNAGQAITVDVTNIPFVEVTDTHDAWNGTTFTAPVDGVYAINAIATFTTSSDRSVLIYKGGSANARLGGVVNTSSPWGSSMVSLLKGESITIRSSTNGGTLTNSSVSHRLTISRIPGQFR